MSSTADSGERPGRPWLAAVAHALLGRSVDGLGEESPDPDALVAALDGGFPGGRPDLVAAIEQVRSRGGPWPVPVPDELRQGLPAAQFAAVLGAVRDRLQIAAGPRSTLSNRPLDAAEQALLREVPPHHVT
ncbi:MAG TPA: hypothetical protein VFP34_09440 [Microlunatus sp.]|nr:hypothetical protein [Microlunatus sp.]